MCTDFRTISDAYSHDCDWMSIRLSASSVIPRMPQWMSEKRLRYSRLRIQVVSGVPKYWCSFGIAPGSIEPFQRDPMTNSCAGAEGLDERREPAEVVRAVRVAHDHAAPADERDGVDVRPSEAALGHPQHPRPVGERADPACHRWRSR